MAEAAYSRSELRGLIDLQRLDSEIGRLRSAIERTLKDPEVLALRDRAAEAARAVQAAKERVTRLKHTAAFEEKESDQLRAEINATERRMYGGAVGNPKELEKMQERVGQLRAELGRHEEAGLGALVELEEAEPAQVEAGRVQEEVRTRLAEAEQRQAETVAGLERELRELEPRRAELAARVPEALLRRYERIRDSHGGVGAAVIRRDGLCGACLVQVPKSLARAVLDGRLETCESCGRLLIHVFGPGSGGEGPGAEPAGDGPPAASGSPTEEGPTERTTSGGGGRA